MKTVFEFVIGLVVGAAGFCGLWADAQDYHLLAEISMPPRQRMDGDGDVLTTLDLGGQPAGALADGSKNGGLLVCIRDQDEVVLIDALPVSP